MHKNLSDSELWSAIKNSDKNALADLFERYYFFLIKSGLHYCKDSEIAKDIASDVFFNLWNKRGSLSEVQNVKSYLAITYRNAIFRFLNSQEKQHMDLAVLTDRNNPSEISFEDLLISLQEVDETKTRLHRAMLKLTPRQKLYLQLKYFEGLTYEEISVQTGQTIKTVYNTTYEALKILRREISF